MAAPEKLFVEEKDSSFYEVPGVLTQLLLGVGDCGFRVVDVRLPALKRFVVRPLCFLNRQESAPEEETQTAGESRK